MDYVTEEELFEMQHQDEMDALDEMDYTNDHEDELEFLLTGGRASNSALNERKSQNNDNASNINKNIQEISTDSDGKSKGISPAESNIVTNGCVNNRTPIKSDDEKENAPVYLTSKRRLSFNNDRSQPSTSKLYTDTHNEDYSQCSESLIDGKSKRTISDVSDDLDDSLACPAVHQFARYAHGQEFGLFISNGRTPYKISVIPDSKERNTFTPLLPWESSKKTRTSLNDTVDNFLRGIIGTQARSSFFDEVRTFTKDQQMITCVDGHRKYFSISDEEDPAKLFPSFSQRTSSLLSVPIDVLKTQYFIMEEENDLRQQTEASLQMSSSANMDVIEEIDIESSLWVEKYRPITYMHLLSEEGINRTLLQWLKLWDKVVFGKEKKAKKKNTDPKKNTQNPKFPKFGELVEDLDEHGRPYHKVAFLCGPPGLGKTTLATIIAKHAGYNVVELNASDDRSPEVFRTNLEAATQMKAVLHEDHRPNCLILDEIDGAPAPSINVLLSFIKSTGFIKGKRKKGDIPLLMRPLICICNDQYTPALRQLRQLSLLLNFPPTTTSRLSSRLNEISLKEGLTADMNALTLLCEKSSNDIRSCLSTLQFIHRMKKAFKVSDLDGMTIGQKDMQKTLFGVWQDVFYYTEQASFDKIHNTVQSFGDYDKVYIGIFENYLNIKFKHRNASFVWSGADWLCFGDIIQQQIAHNQLFFLQPYLPYPAVAFHLLFASNTFPIISYPAPFYECKSRTFQLSSTLSSMIKDMVSTLKTFLNTSVLLLDIFPFLQEIIKPNLRPVNTQLYSEREKSELRRVIELMLAFNMNYRQERQQDGTYTYVLDPNIEELTKFSGIKSSKALTYSAKQMIAREVDMEQMRKGDAQETAHETRQQKTVQSVAKKVPEKKTVVEKPMLDFFGRKIVGTAKTKKKAKVDPRDEEIWFHFKEGYSNAVRRPVYIKDLL